MSIKKSEPSSFTKELIASLTPNQLKKSDIVNRKNKDIVFQMADPNSTHLDDESPSLKKSILNVLNGGQGHSIERLAFEQDPSFNNTFSSIYKAKVRGIPDTFLKRIAVQNSLVASILTCRSAMMQTFGRPQPDRHSLGFVIKPIPGLLTKMNEEQKEDLNKRIDECQKKLITCGSTQNVKANRHMTFAQFLGLCTRDAITVGRAAVEVVHALDAETGEMVFHSFRPIDAGTIYQAAPFKEEAQAVRDSAKALLEQIKNEKFLPEKFEADEYSWIQVVNGRPLQAFTDTECLVHNFYPVTDIEWDGYPITPIDTAIGEITSYINIVNHNKLYFQSGRASRGMLVIKSEDVNPLIVENIKQQFNASINSVGNSWRLPTFGLGLEDEISWIPIDSGGRDMEFQYLSDNTSRVILSAFQMSPEEIPGWAHLSRGTNSQALSECLSPTSNVITPSGYKSLGGILNGSDSVNSILWNGTSWKEVRIFSTGQKEICQTKLSNGLQLQTSPDHRFEIIGENGTPSWKQQKDLVEGDWVLVNKKPIPGSVDNIPLFEGKALTVEMMEVLGWVTGDGTFINRKTSSSLQMFYHHELERGILQRHVAFLRNFGLDPHPYENVISSEESQRIAKSRGFKSISTSRIGIRLHNEKFVKWLMSLGFSSGAGRTDVSHEKGDGKSIPSFIHTLPIEYRQAFLRGFFSADGGKLNNTGTVGITIQANKLRTQTRDLLMGLGIRSLPCEGLARNQDTQIIGNNDFSYKIFIKDRAEFWKQIGFIQDFKQPDECVEKWKNGDLPSSLSSYCAQMCLETGYSFKKTVRDSLVVLARKGNRSCSVNFIKRTMDQCGVSIPWMEEYNWEKVVLVERSKQLEAMVDVEVFDSRHAFVANFISVHNSDGEFKLEAGRDVGIRPLISNFEDFINHRIFPLLDPALAKLCTVRLIGLDAESPQKESVRLQTDSMIHMTFDELLEAVEKEPVGLEIGGSLPLNPAFLQLLDKYFTVGEIKEHFCGIKGASKNPEDSYRRDPFWFQMQQIVQQQQMAQQQAQQQAQQPQQGAPGQDQQAQPQGPAPEGSQQGPSEDDEDLSRSLDQVIGLLDKSERYLPPSRRRLLHQQHTTVTKLMASLESDLEQMTKDVIDIVKPFDVKG